MAKASQTTEPVAQATTEPVAALPVATPAPAAKAESPEAKAVQAARSIAGRLPRLAGEETVKLTTKGDRVTRLDAFDWDRVHPDKRSLAKAAVRLVIADESRERALDGFSRAS